MYTLRMALYRVNFVSKLGTIDIVNVLHVVTESDVAWPLTPPNPSPAEVAAEVNSKVQAPYRSMLGANATLERISVSTVPKPGDPSQVPTVGEYAVGVAGARAVADPDLPPALCGHITWRTASAGKSFRGRSFCPPIEQKGEIEDNLLTTGGDYFLAMTFFADTIEDANLDSGSTWSSLWRDTWHGRFVVYSPTRHAADESPWTSDITVGVPRRDIGELRSRRK